MKRRILSERERRAREIADREQAISDARDADVRGGRLESWSGGRVRPLIEDDDR